ncbi:LOW QUALITY PROTEIN: uncharacterized protein O3C94_011839 [Discoglossus pictus]
MIREASLKDAVGSMGVGSVNYTWSRPDGSVRSRIDFLFTSKALKHRQHDMVPCFFSDHRAVRLLGDLGKGFAPGPGSWKLNSTLLEREEIMTELRALYLEWKEEKCCFPTVAQWWEFVKVKLRSFFQARGRCLKRDGRSDFKGLQNRLQCLQDLELCGWNVREEMEEAKESLKRHFEEESKRLIFRSKVEHLEKGEKCNSANTPLSELRDNTGVLREGRDEVMQVVSDFYRDLYSLKQTDNNATERFLSELFAEYIRGSPEIRGITEPGPDRRQVKCSLYMDDVTIFCSDERSVRTLVQVCEDFGRASGAKVNCGKSETALFGEWHLTSAPLPFPIKSDLIKILGVWFGGKGAALKCWEERLARVQQKFGLWSLRDLSMEGKILVLRNEILPVLQYVAQAWPPLTSVCRAISKAVFYFIWGSKMDRVKRSVCKEPLKGGKGVPDIPTMLHFFACNCVRRAAGVAMSRFFLLPLWRGFGWTTPWFYQDVVKFVREHQLQSIKPHLWTPKVIYKLLRSKDIMESVDGLPAKTAETVWDNVSSKRMTNRHKDTARMAIEGGLPLRQFMLARGLCRYRHCPRGSSKQSEPARASVSSANPFWLSLLGLLASSLETS